ncbi:interferon-induced protein 44-like [Haliotis asinina]|uniref:interferon-induced protein 44-like n=1 Tax=Haliotis asinina TaxID=109174 RepID=UPI003531F498
MTKLFNRLCEEMLMHWLEGRKTFRLLFESKNSSNVPHDFHRCCDKKEATVSIFFAENSSFGGYTSASWEAKPSGSKPDRDAFVFKLYDRGSFNPRKYDTDDHSCSIYCHPLYGPTFGGGDHAKARRDIETRLERRSPPGRDIVMILADLGQTYNSQKHHGHERLVYNSTAQTRFQVYQVLDDKGYLPSPWTQVSDNNDKMIADTEGYCSPLDHVKILLVGQQGAGQSSYIHSIRSAFRGYVTSAHSTEAASRTSKRMEHEIRRGHNRAGLGLWLCESQGLETSQETAPAADSLWTKFASWIVDLIDSYRKSTHLQNMQGIVFVIDGSTIDDLPKHIKREFDQWKDIANKYKILQTVVLTKIDLVCSLAGKDLSLTFQSSQIADLVDKTAELMGLPRSHIFPVKNYVEELELEKEVDRLTLFSLRQTLRFIQDRQKDSVQSSRPQDMV